MAILAYGINYRTASVDVRERLAFTEDALVPSLADLTHRVSGVSEAAIVSTCNRTELYCALDPDAFHDVAGWFADNRNVSNGELSSHAYRHWDREAADHSIRVAAGLDSQVLGEPEILGQVKTAFDVARNAGTLGPELNLLSQVTLNTAKKVRTTTDIGRNPVSVAYAAVTLAQQIFTDIRNNRALLLGAGDTIHKVAEHLAARGMHQMAIANRTLANAQRLASRFQADAMQLTDVADRLSEFDIVIASTGSSLPVVGKGSVEAALRARRHKPIFMVDIAVPRDVEPGVGDLPDVYLYTIDDLSEIIRQNLEQREQAAAAAEDLVRAGAERFLREQRAQHQQETLRLLRHRADSWRDDELQKALAELQRGADPEAALAQLARNLTNKLMHNQTVALRNAAADGRTDLVDYLKSLYQLD